jgi:hypothetical protein
MVYDGNVKIVGRLPYTPSDLLKVLQALQIDWRVAPRREPIFWGPRRG